MARKGTPVVATVCRKKVVTSVIERTNASTLQSFARKVMSHKVSLFATDEDRVYETLSPEYPHFAVKHSLGAYVGAIRTNTIEGFWSTMKRGIMGTFHKVSKKYLPLYVAELQFRYNNRENADIFGTAISGC